ncbi:type II secretion system F family protein [Helicobacter pametensis]|uniref:type II secretion system F family protein n=1 Tax=Helicobacter pametensis TaxID=95149 RepID=UPI000482D490|nr:type II secretion system F family protein [Helicobacter pametensis]
MRYKITTLKHTSIHRYTIWAKSKDDAWQKAIRKDGIPPLQVEESLLISLPISSQDTLISLKQLHMMIAANIPIQECLDSLTTHTHNTRLAQVFAKISHSLENGLSLYESFAPYENIFGKLTLVMIEFGSRSGKLDLCLKLLLDELNNQEKSKKAIKKALFYPLFVLLCTIACFMILIQMVVPQFIELFAQNNLALPIYTKILIGTHTLIAQYGHLILLAMAILIPSLWIQISNKGKLYQLLLSFILKIPWIGTILLNLYLYRYFFTLSILLQSGIDLLSCTNLAQESIESQTIQHKLRAIRISLVNGKTLHEALKESNLFDPLTLNLILVAQRSGQLEEILRTCATNYSSRANSMIEFLISLIEPCFTLLLGLFVLLLALGIFTPIWNLS